MPRTKKPAKTTLAIPPAAAAKRFVALENVRAAYDEYDLNVDEVTAADMTATLAGKMAAGTAAEREALEHAVVAWAAAAEPGDMLAPDREGDAGWPLVFVCVGAGHTFSTLRKRVVQTTTTSFDVHRFVDR